MTLGKAVTLGVLGALAWQHQALIKSKLKIVEGVVPTFQTYGAMRTLREPLAKHMEENRGRLPGNVSAWIAQSFKSTADERMGYDYFGNPYQIARDQNREPYLQSCGPDGRCGNEDDLLVKIGPPLKR